MSAAKKEIPDESPYTIYVAPNLAAEQSLTQLVDDFKQLLLDTREIFVIDFSSSHSLHQVNLSSILSLAQTLKSAQKKLYSINVNSSLAKQFSDKGLLKTINVVKSLNDIPNSTTTTNKQTPAQSKLNADVVKQFVQGAAKTFSVQVKAAIHVKSITTKRVLYSDTDDIVGTIYVSTQGFEGLVALCLSLPTFINLYKALLGETIESITDDNSDAVSELINMVYGHAKTTLNATQKINLKPAIPRTLLKPGSQKSDYNVVNIEFTSDLGPFRIEVLVK